ncbi:MAG TPA: D-alanyl-D-alanine carboxypeptidase family protein [Patescibacteria group bacterium]|nr:D-alanyl-D-alanine carboxypeptidase family protein [Patescibacteria group bacterium]
MRGWLIYLITILLVTALACLTVWLWEPVSQEIHALSFPVPSNLALPTNNQVATLDLWSIPLTLADTNMQQMPTLSAKSALVYDITDNTTLFAKDATQRLPMASLTKIMTAIVSLEHPQNPDAYTVSQKALVGEDSMGLTTGEVLTLSDLLYGLILNSGNDAAETLAANFPGGRDKFIAAMNEKTATLGLSDTHFTNPTGLQGDGDQYTTSRDLLIMTRYALLHFPLFRQVAATFDNTIPATNTHKAFYMENETNLISSYPGVKGVKTGYTPEAGLCLVTYLDYGGHHIIGVVLDSESRRDDMKELLDYSLKKLGVTPPRHG